MVFWRGLLTANTRWYLQRDLCAAWRKVAPESLPGIAKESLLSSRIISEKMPCKSTSKSRVRKVLVALKHIEYVAKIKHVLQNLSFQIP